MDAAARRTLSDAIPFNKHLGLEIVELAPGRGVVRLPDEPHLTNHVGTQHAAALFAAAEAASGAAVVGALGGDLARVTPLARGAEVTFKKPARGPITATATLRDDAPAFVARALAEGRADADVVVAMTDASGVEVGSMTVRWHLRASA